jgi:DNA-binding response OmpR family regulator
VPKVAADGWLGSEPGGDIWIVVTQGATGRTTTACGPTVVVAAADIDLRRAVADILYDEGYVVTEVGDGETAGNLLRTGRFDALVLDKELPGMEAMSGLTGVGQHPPVVVMSGPEEDAGQRRSLAVRGIASLVTPVNPEHLLDAVASAVSRPA